MGACVKHCTITSKFEDEIQSFSHSILKHNNNEYKQIISLYTKNWKMKEIYYIDFLKIYSEVFNDIYRVYDIKDCFIRHNFSNYSFNDLPINTNTNINTNKQAENSNNRNNTETSPTKKHPNINNTSNSSPGKDSLNNNQINQTQKTNKINLKELLIFLFPLSNHINKSNTIKHYIELLEFNFEYLKESKRIVFNDLVKFLTKFYNFQTYILIHFLEVHYKDYAVEGGPELYRKFNISNITTYSKYIAIQMEECKEERECFVKLNENVNEYVDVSSIQSYLQIRDNIMMINNPTFLRKEIEDYIDKEDLYLS